MCCLPLNRLTTQYVRTISSAQSNPFDDVIIFNIIPFLDQNDMIRFASVCSSWRQSCFSPHAHKKFITSRYYDIDRLDIAKGIPSTFGDLSLLFTDFEIRYDITKSQFKSIIQSPKVICFKTFNFYSSTLKGCYLNISSLSVISTKLTKNDVLIMIKYLKELKQLILIDNGLKRVDLNWFLTLESLTIFNPIKDSNVKQIFKPNAISTLKELKLEFEESKTIHTFDFDGGLFPNLTLLSIIGLLLHERTITSILNSGINFKTFAFVIKYLGAEIDEQICKCFSKQMLIEDLTIGKSETIFKYLNGSNLKLLTTFDIQKVSTEDFPLMENLSSCTFDTNCIPTPSTTFQFQQFFNYTPNLTSLNIIPRLQSSLEPLVNLSNLKHLYINFNRPSDIKFISTIRSLESLILGSLIDIVDINYITKGELLHLKQLKIIHYANIESMKIFDDSNLKNVRELKLYFLADALKYCLNSSFMKQIRVLDSSSTKGMEFDILISWLTELNFRGIDICCPNLTLKQKETVVELCRNKRIKLIGSFR